MNKKQRSFLMLLSGIVMIFIMCINTYAITIYAPDGRTEWVDETNLDRWTSAGWYTEPVMAVYSTDGRELIIPKSQLDAYKSVGWYEPITMYSLDGRSAKVKIYDVEAWKAVGWYTEPVMAVYSTDGRELIIPKSQLDEYRNVGWYEPITMYSLDGRSAEVKIYDVEAWEAVGWYRAETKVTLYSPDGRTMEMYASLLGTYTSYGWYTEPVMTVYAADGRTLVIPRSQLEAYKEVGWQATKPVPNARKPKVSYALRNQWTKRSVIQLCDKIDYTSDFSGKVSNESFKMYSAASSDQWDEYITCFNNAKNYAKTTADLFYDVYLYSCNYADVRIYAYEYAKTYPNIAKCQTLQDLLYYIYSIYIEISNTTIPDTNEELIYFYNMLLEANEAKIKLMELSLEFIEMMD